MTKAQIAEGIINELIKQKKETHRVDSRTTYGFTIFKINTLLHQMGYDISYKEDGTVSVSEKEA